MSDKKCVKCMKPCKKNICNTCDLIERENYLTECNINMAKTIIKLENTVNTLYKHVKQLHDSLEIIQKAHININDKDYA